ncbi:MAG: hypothetical protein AVDCRST_MAG01-01-2861, partial [uncultured Rubrobacteraceae bacterium]
GWPEAGRERGRGAPRRDLPLRDDVGGGRLRRLRRDGEGRGFDGLRARDGHRRALRLLRQRPHPHRPPQRGRPGPVLAGPQGSCVPDVRGGHL